MRVANLVARLKERHCRFRERRGRLGLPDLLGASPLGLVRDVLRWGRLGRYIWLSRTIRGWTRGAEAVAVAQASARLNRSPVIVEIGSFLGCSTVLLAGARKLEGSGRVHCVDPFAATGDAFSVPIYQSIAKSLGMPMRTRFAQNIRAAGLLNWVTVHQMTAADAAAQWREPIDLLLLDGDQSPKGASDTYLQWSRFLRRDGVLVINATSEGPNEPEHDGSMRVIRECLHAPDYRDIRRVGGMTFAIKEADYTPAEPTESIKEST